jgi:hypothetical protein
MPPKAGERTGGSLPLKAAVGPKSPKGSPKIAPGSPQLKPLHAGNTRAVLSVPVESVGVVIGKEGKTLHRIERMFSVSVKVAKDGAAQDHELCIIEGGDAGNVAKCEAYISGIFRPEFELMLPDDGVVIPKRLSGRLIGARGSNKELFERNSGAVIEYAYCHMHYNQPFVTLFVDGRYDEERAKVLIKGTKQAVAAAAVLVRKFISDELLPKRKLGHDEQNLVLEADKAGIHLNTNQLDTFSKCLKDAYTLALKSFAAEDAQLSVILKKQGVTWTWRSDVLPVAVEQLPPALALELERLHIDANHSAVLCLPDSSCYEVSLSSRSARNVADGSLYQLHRNCTGPTLHATSSSASRSAAPTTSEADAKAADLSHRLVQFGFQHREITICLRNGCPPEKDAMINALTELQACTWLSNSAAQHAKKSGAGAAVPSSSGLVPMFVKPQQDAHQKAQPSQSSSVSTRRPVVLDGSNIALRHGAFNCFQMLFELA